MRRSSSLKKSIAVAAAILIAAGSVADARPGGGRSFGSRGANSFSPPPVTNTAPRQAQPFPGSGYATPSQSPMGMPAPQAARPRFGGGLLGGLAAGFIGAGLFGMLTGHGFMGGIGGLFSFLGLLVQIALVVMVAKFALNWWRRRNQPAMAGAPREMFREAPMGMPGAMAGGMAGGMAGAGPAVGFGQPRPAPATQPLTLGDADFNRFEELLGEVQTAYGRGDQASLARVATPEVANQMGGDLDENARRGVINKVTSPKLLQGDLSEAWSEPGAEYATVAMRFSVIDVMLDKASGRVVGGDPVRPNEATEVWTFVRKPGAGPQGWVLSAIQQA